MPPALIVEYDPAWPGRALRLLREVRAAFVSLAGTEYFVYEHIGSTAVPGLAAKPYVDLQVRMPSLSSLAELADILAPTPFVPAFGARPDSPGVHRDIPRPGDHVDLARYEKRLFYAPTEAAILHIRRTDSPFAEFVVEFRDWLRHHPDRARRYEQLKRDLAVRHANDSDYDDYTRAKSAFLDEIQPHLRDWVRHHRPIPPS
ncbi:MAG TPA: GrpB family protein [Actinokineospora sp.]|jgi:dephospho-CoA kinase|nr:GrpB family protein [Actinokineospora sp.]